MSSGRAADETALIERARQGDSEAFEVIVRTHADAVYGHALRFFGDPATAEDAAQEVFIKVFRSLPSFDGRSSMSTWLYRVTRNTCLDLFRQGRRRAVPVDPVDLADRIEQDFSAAVIDTQLLEQAIAALQPEDRDALGAVGLFGLSYAEAADVLEVPVGTVKSRVFRARKALVAMLGMTRGVE